MSERTTMNRKPVFTVPTKTVINFDSRFDKKLLCDGITFTAGNACNYSCTFCYVESMQRKAQEWMEKHGVAYPPEGHSGVVIRTDQAVEIARKQILSKPEAFRRSQKVIYASPKVDVAGNMELVRETIEICKVIMEHTDWHIRLLSKSNLLPKIAELICAESVEDAIFERLIFGVSTGTLDDNLAAAFEVGTAKVSKRIESLHWLQDNGFRTFGMICPSLPFDGAADGAYIKFGKEMKESIRADRCEHVWAEVINVRGESFQRTEWALQEAGYHAEAVNLSIVSHNPSAWEHYARSTMDGHIAAGYRPGQLRFLQYVNNHNRDWWKNKVSQGAVLL
ncbi:MAG: hypothetical protein KGL39_54385 [Patescibacteria group bacterium]|nr:hypothetical protein [Patescibacteria group bacterium]